MVKTIFLKGSENLSCGVMPSNDERFVNNVCSEVVYFYLPKVKEAKENERISSENVKELTFYEMLNPICVKQLQKYLKTHRLSESEEYQLIVSLGMEMDDEQAAERIISGYIRRYGLRSVKARQVLKDLGFDEALSVLRVVTKSDDIADDEPTIAEKLRDGFLMMKDDDVADRGFFITYWGEVAQA